MALRTAVAGPPRATPHASAYARPARAVLSACAGRVRRPEPRPARGDAQPRARLRAARDGALLFRRPVGRARARGPRRRRRLLLAAEPVADPARARPAPPDPPLARRPAAPGRGPRRPEDRPLQRARLLHRT